MLNRVKSWVRGAFLWVLLAFAPVSFATGTSYVDFAAAGITAVTDNIVATAVAAFAALFIVYLGIRALPIAWSIATRFISKFGR